MSPDAKPILDVAKLVKRFGGFYALDGLSFHVVSGEILGLVGPNGSGKTTAINVISGLYAPDGGEVVFDGASIGGVASHKLVHGGINRTFQVPKPFLSLTVRQNIQVALSYGYAQTAPPTIDELLDEYRLREVADRPAADLNSAQQKMLDLTRALATRPRLLLRAIPSSATSTSIPHCLCPGHSSAAGCATAAPPSTCQSMPWAPVSTRRHTSRLKAEVRTGTPGILLTCAAVLG